MSFFSDNFVFGNILILKNVCSAANKGRSTVNYRQSSVFDGPFLHHIMIIVTGGFSRNFFFINIIFISQKFFWTILNLFSWNLNTFRKHKEQICFLFICSFFTRCFVIILCINALKLFVLFHCIYTHTHTRTHARTHARTQRMSLFSFCLLFRNHSM